MILSPTKFHLLNTRQKVFRKSFVLRLVIRVGKEIHIPETNCFLGIWFIIIQFVEGFRSILLECNTDYCYFFKMFILSPCLQKLLLIHYFLSWAHFLHHQFDFSTLHTHLEPSEHHHHAWHNITQIQIRLLSGVLNYRSRNHYCSYQNLNIFQKCFWKCFIKEIFHWFLHQITSISWYERKH